MKSYNHLWEKLISRENIIAAIIISAKHKRNNGYRHRMLRFYAQDPESHVEEVHDWILDYKPTLHRVKHINDGISAKIREIVVPTFQEVIIHNAVLNVLKPILSKGMYEHSYASIPTRGTHRCAKRTQRWLKNNPRYTKYCLKLDIEKFFQSIPQEQLLARLREVIHDNWFYELVRKIIVTVPSGLPLGFTPSQWFANWYLTPLDHYIKEVLKVKLYARFMDDMTLYDSNKRRLHKTRLVIQAILESIGLKLKYNWQLFRVQGKTIPGRFIDFLGFKFYRDRMTLRGRLARKIRRKAARLRKKPKVDIHSARQMVTYLGYMKYVDCYTWYVQYIKPQISVRRLRIYISKYDKAHLYAA